MGHSNQTNFASPIRCRSGLGGDAYGSYVLGVNAFPVREGRAVGVLQIKLGLQVVLELVVDLNASALSVGHH